MADTEHTVTVEHNLDEYAKQLEDINSAWEKHNEHVKTANAQLKSFTAAHKDMSGLKPPPEYAAQPPGAPQREKSPFEETSSDRNLNRRYQQQTVEKYIPETLKYYKSFNSFSSAIIGGVA